MKRILFTLLLLVGIMQAGEILTMQELLTKYNRTEIAIPETVPTIPEFARFLNDNCAVTLIKEKRDLETIQSFLATDTTDVTVDVVKEKVEKRLFHLMILEELAKTDSVEKAEGKQ